MLTEILRFAFLGAVCSFSSAERYDKEKDYYGPPSRTGYKERRGPPPFRNKGYRDDYEYGHPKYEEPHRYSDYPEYEKRESPQYYMEEPQPPYYEEERYYNDQPDYRAAENKARSYYRNKYRCADDTKLKYDGTFECGIWTDMYPHEVELLEKMFKDKKQIKRKVRLVDDGVLTDTYSDYPEMALWIQQHVAQSQDMVKRGARILYHKASNRALSQKHKEGQTGYNIKYNEKGAALHQYGRDDCAASLIQVHALGVNDFVEYGLGKVYEDDQIPTTCGAYGSNIRYSDKAADYGVMDYGGDQYSSGGYDNMKDQYGGYEEEYTEPKNYGGYREERYGGGYGEQEEQYGGGNEYFGNGYEEPMGYDGGYRETATYEEPQYPPKPTESYIRNVGNPYRLES